MPAQNRGTVRSLSGVTRGTPFARCEWTRTVVPERLADGQLDSTRIATMTTTTSPSLPDATKLAVDRTRLAHERTLMAWVRTSTSLISFGFTIYKFFQYLQEKDQGAAHATLIGPRGFALLMIGIGLTALVLATVEHRRSLRALRAEYGGGVVPYSLATFIGALIGLLGFLGLLAVAFRQ